MVAKLKLVSKNPIFNLAFKSLIVALTSYWFRASGFNFLNGILFFSSILVFYFASPINSKNFIVTFLVFPLTILFLPIYSGVEFLIALTIGGAFYCLLSIKDLTHFKRDVLYETLHFLAILSVIALLKVGLSPFTGSVFLVFLLREFYSSFQDFKKNIWLISFLETLIIYEVIWVISFFGINGVSAAALTTAIVFISHNFIKEDEVGNLSSSIILRNLTIIFIFLIIVFLVRN